MVDVQILFQFLEVNLSKKHCYRGVRSVVVQPTYCAESVLTVQLKNIHLLCHLLFNYRYFFMYVCLLITVAYGSHITSLTFNLSVH